MCSYWGGGFWPVSNGHNTGLHFISVSKRKPFLNKSTHFPLLNVGSLSKDNQTENEIKPQSVRVYRVSQSAICHNGRRAITLLTQISEFVHRKRYKMWLFTSGWSVRDHSFTLAAMHSGPLLLQSEKLQSVSAKWTFSRNPSYVKILMHDGSAACCKRKKRKRTAE